MCECGCGDLRLAKLAIPGGWLGVDFYPGCADCGTGYGLTLVKLDADHEDTEFLVEGVPDITFDRYGRWSQYIASLEALREVWREYADKDSEADDIMGDFIQHDGLRDVFYRTQSAEARP